MRTLLLILLLLLSSCLGIQMPVTGPDAPPPDEPTARYNVVIESAQLAMQDGQAALTVSGYIPDGCEFPVSTALVQNGTAITVDIYRTGPAGVMCPDVIVDYRDTLPLPDLDPGAYTVTVNTYTFRALVPFEGATGGRPTPEPPRFDPPAATE